ncbi:MAG TPA: hypothetical protein VFE62_28690 [Gemmataceae bacterium]|nr:hypothetical protein [Gemmataceae bacterium]
MPLVCPQCKQLYEQNGVCPLCNVVLLYHAANLQNDHPTPTSIHDDGPPQWQQTPWGKIVVGLILAQGLRFGLQQVLTAGFLASDGTADVWQTLAGIVLHHAVHAVSLLVGGALAGAGQRGGIVYGGLVGMASGIISLFWQYHAGEDFSSILIYAEPVIHLTIGALGGALGMLIWRPIPRIPELEGTPTPVPIPTFNISLSKLFSGPVYFGRVSVGAFVIVVGVVWSKAILEFLLRASSGTLTISSHLQAQLVSMEIAALVALIGSCFAGATTRNGFKQGFCVGLAASVIVLGIQISNPKFTIESSVFTMGGIILVSLVGGWFGGQLFPPIDPSRRKRRFSIYS